ncbi:short chain dehydrogenase, partial [Vibrio alginolyticus]|nr:short chain dehydrogenase [Vibrio alginolyticus]
MELANKVIAITGAGQGLGKQMALSLAENGV